MVELGGGTHDFRLFYFCVWYSEIWRFLMCHIQTLAWMVPPRRSPPSRLRSTCDQKQLFHDTKCKRNIYKNNAWRPPAPPPLMLSKSMSKNVNISLYQQQNQTLLNLHWFLLICRGPRRWSQKPALASSKHRFKINIFGVVFLYRSLHDFSFWGSERPGTRSGSDSSSLFSWLGVVRNLGFIDKTRLKYLSEFSRLALSIKLV